MNGTLLFNPTSIVHDRNVEILKRHLPEWHIRCVYNLRQPWFSGKDQADGAYCFKGGKFPQISSSVFNDVKCLILFTAQARVPPCILVEEAAARSIPVVAIEEVYMMMLEYGHINNYVLPVDKLFVASEYERERFIGIGVPDDTVETTGCVFDAKNTGRCTMEEKADLKRKIGLSADKHTATLCLSYLFAGGETLDVRRQLVTLISQGLPKEYQLLIKPHPAEQDKNFAKFIKKYAPNAVLARTDTPIDKVLEITDVLFNRGNSQVVVDALKGGVPVIAVPVGRRTIFHDLLLDKVIVNHSEDVARALEAAMTDGMKIYDMLFQSCLSVTTEDALNKIIKRVSRIAETGERRNPAERLMELSLFWDWMGYAGQALGTLLKARRIFDVKGVSENIEKLIKRRLDRKGLISLKQWIGKETYREWVLKSLWIKKIYMKNEKLDAEDVKWLAGYPPSMNRGLFLQYAYKLYWCYIRSGIKPEADRLISALKTEFSYLKEVELLARRAENQDTFYGKLFLWNDRVKYTTELILKDLACRLS